MSEQPFKPRDENWHPPALYNHYRSTQFRSPNHKLLQINPTRIELTSPVFDHSDIQPLDHDLIHNYATQQAAALGPRIIVHGKLMDEDGRAIPNTLIEIWQANAGGRYRHKNDSYLAPLDENFGGCGRCLSKADGSYRFYTIMPGAYPWPNGPNSWRPAHIHFSIFGQGFTQRLITQMYFEGDPLIDICPIVQSIPNPKAIDKLIARLDLSQAVSMDMLAYRFDLVLRGRDANYFENS